MPLNRFLRYLASRSYLLRVSQHVRDIFVSKGKREMSRRYELVLLESASGAGPNSAVSSIT